MKVWKYNSVFDHVESTLFEMFGDEERFKNVVFVLGYNLLTSLDSIRQEFKGHYVIVYQLEQFYDGANWAKKEHINVLAQADEIWDYDSSNIQWLQSKTRLKSKFMPMVYTESLKRLPSIHEKEPDIDFLFYGYMHERRAKLIYHLQAQLQGKAKVVTLYGAWGEELDEYISRSKIILNIHTDDTAKQEQVRMYYPVINGRCVVSEGSPQNYLGNAIVQDRYENLAARAISLWKTGKWKDVANNASAIYQEISSKYKPKKEILK
jgi:hypothetical protein